jgi:hypothetical protein
MPRRREQVLQHDRMVAARSVTTSSGVTFVVAMGPFEEPLGRGDVTPRGDDHVNDLAERRLLFDLNDFDETLPGPFEYDVKHMAASFTIAGRNNGFTKTDINAATLASVAAYRQAMAGFAAMGTMDIWYAHLDEDELLKGIRGAAAEAQKSKKGAKAAKRAEKAVAKAHTRHNLQALSKLGELVDGRYRIVSQPPIVVPARELEATYGLSPRQDRPPDPGTVPRLPGHSPG